MYNPGFKFVVEPEHFNKYTDRELLQYCLGATMYMPGFKDFTPKILNNSIPGLTTIVLCFEDAWSGRKSSGSYGERSSSVGNSNGSCGKRSVGCR